MINTCTKMRAWSRIRPTGRKRNCDRRRGLRSDRSAAAPSWRGGIFARAGAQTGRAPDERVSSGRASREGGLVIALLIANSLALASLVILLASGVALIYGLRDVINFGHGAIYMLGAYLGYTVALVGGFWLALVVVPILLAILGVAFEYLALRPLQSRSHIEVALVTLGLGIILGQIIIFFYGGVARSVDAPQVLSGSVPVGGLSYPG